MAKRNIKKIISVLAAVTVIASQMVFSMPMASAVAINGPVYVNSSKINIKDMKATKTASESKTVALDSGTLTGSFAISFDMIIDSVVADNSFTLTFNGSNKVSGFLKLGAYNASTNSYPVLWNEKADTSLGANVEVGKKYTYQILFTHVGDGVGAAAQVIVVDEDGKELANVSALPCRNFSDPSNGAAKVGFAQAVMTLAAKDEATPASLTFENFQSFQMGPTDINVTVDSAVVDGEAEGETVEVEEILLEAAGNKTIYVPAAGEEYVLTSNIKDYGVVYGIKEEISGVSIDGDKLVITSKAPEGESTFTLTAAIEGSESSTADMQIVINKEAAAAEDVVADAVKELIIADEDGKSVSEDGKTLTTTKNLVLSQGDDFVDIVWECFIENEDEDEDEDKWVESDVIDVKTGEYTITEGFSGKAKLVATITSKKDDSVSDTKTFYVKISNPEVQLDLDLEELKEYMEDYEEVTKSFDLPTEGKYGSDITWTSSKPSVITTKGKVTRSTSNKTVTLTATLENGGETIDEEFEVVVEKKKTSGGGGGSSSSGISKNTGGDSYTFYTPVTTTLTTPVSTPVPNPVVNKTNQAQNLNKVEANTAKFNDLAGVEWASEAINALADKGVINGKGEGKFAPNDSVTRAEFAKILVQAFGLADPNATANALTDVKQGDWYYNAVASAYTKGVITGKGDGTFGVNDQISRQDMAVLIYRAAKAANIQLPVLKEEVKYADGANIADYAKEAVTALQRAGIVNGVSETEFAPTATATRAAAAQMIYRTYNMQ